MAHQLPLPADNDGAREPERAVDTQLARAEDNRLTCLGDGSMRVPSARIGLSVQTDVDPLSAMLTVSAAASITVYAPNANHGNEPSMTMTMLNLLEHLRGFCASLGHSNVVDDD